MKHLATAITTAILAIATIALANDYEILNTDTDELETENCYEEIEPRTINIERDKAVQRFLEEERKALGKKPIVANASIYELLAENPELERELERNHKRMVEKTVDFAIEQYKKTGLKPGNFYITPEGGETVVIKSEIVFPDLYALTDPAQTLRVRQVVDKCEGEEETELLIRPVPAPPTTIGTVGIKKDGKVETKKIKSKPKPK